MELLFSNLLPHKTKYKKFYDQFYSDFGLADNINIAVGYITADSISMLKKTLEVNEPKHLNLIIGMHYFDKFTKIEYNAAIDLHEFLTTQSIGSVKLVKPFKFHGKLYSYSKNSKVFSSVIGSDNLSSILDSKTRVYESSIRLSDEKNAPEINNFILDLMNTSTEDIDKCNISEFKSLHNVLEDHEFVEKLTTQELANCVSNLTDIKFYIPLKTEPKSNLNVFHGKGRIGSNKVEKPRHWYEVELIVSSSTTKSEHYPKVENGTATFDVITDDGWKFKCKVSGDYNKNFRSENDLKILGKWIKGRLENHGALRVGEFVTSETLSKYGRDNFELIKTKIPNTWYLNMGIK